MNDSELDRLLRQSSLPKPESADWERLAAGAMEKLASGRQAPAHGDAKTQAGWWSRWRPWPGWPLAASAATVVGAALILFCLGGPGVRPQEIADARRVYDEVRLLFPDQIEALILGGPSPRLQIAEHPSSPVQRPVLVKFCSPRGCQTVITFSGVNVALQDESCEVLLDSHNQVIVVGQRFVWSSQDEKLSRGGYQITAEALPESL
jgi:hypothetical protein